jgi:hypothetical protein
MLCSPPHPLLVDAMFLCELYGKENHIKSTESTQQSRNAGTQTLFALVPDLTLI